MNKVIIESTAEVPKDAPLAVNPLAASSSAVMIDTAPSVEDTLKPKVSLTSNTKLGSKATEFSVTPTQNAVAAVVSSNVAANTSSKPPSCRLVSKHVRESEMISQQSARHPC